MNIYYWEKAKNFGDLLTSYLVKRFTHLESEWSEPDKAELVMTGSILEKIPRNWKGVIAGAGKLHENTIVDFPEAKILALRGPLTARGVRGDFVIGDPGLLADELVGLQPKEHDLGIIPHWTDRELEHDLRFKQFKPFIIRVADDPLEVIRQIGSCKKIISSSLHGIILADAFSIPRRIEIAPRMVTHVHQEGGLFKWHDYSASLNMKLEVGITQEPDRNLVIEKQHELFDVLEEIKSIFLST